VPAIDFVPHSAPLARGIHLTIVLCAADLDGEPRALLEAAYADASLVRVQDGEIALGSVIGSCTAVLGATSRAGAHVVFVALDNLLKGGAGQAVQSLNLVQGWDEILGLPTLGVWP